MFVKCSKDTQTWSVLHRNQHRTVWVMFLKKRYCMWALTGFKHALHRQIMSTTCSSSFEASNCTCFSMYMSLFQGNAFTYLHVDKECNFKCQYYHLKLWMFEVWYSSSTETHALCTTAYHISLMSTVDLFSVIMQPLEVLIDFRLFLNR